MVAVQLARSLLLVSILLDLCQVADNVGAPVLVNFYLAGFYHLVYPADRVLPLIDLHFPCADLLLHLLNLGVLLLDFGGQLLAVKRGGLL